MLVLHMSDEAYVVIRDRGDSRFEVSMLCYSSYTLCIQGAELAVVHPRPHHPVVTVLFSKFTPLFPWPCLYEQSNYTICIYYVQLFATVCEQSHTNVHIVMCLFYYCSKLRNTRTRRRYRRYYNCQYYIAIIQETIKILTACMAAPSTRHSCHNFCVSCNFVNVVIMSHIYEPRVRRMGIFASF